MSENIKPWVINNSLKLGISVLWTALVAMLLYYFLDVIPAECSKDDPLNLCRVVPLLYFWIFAIMAAMYGIMVAFLGNPLRFAIVAFVGIASFAWAFIYSAQELSDARTYGYEKFLIIFYLWVAALFTLFISSIVFPERRKAIATFSIIGTILATYFFAFFGRGSIEQIYPLVGGLFEGISWETLVASKLFLLIAAMLASVLSYAFGIGMLDWVEKGKFFHQNLYSRAVKPAFLFMAIASVSLLSLPPGSSLNKEDVESAKGFIENLKVRLEDFRQQKKQYPKLLSEAFPDGWPDNTPLLIDRYEYLSLGFKGAYYFSRPDKYCMVFQDTGKDFGYHSVTSNRDWKQFKVAESIEKQFESVCDEEGPTSHEPLIAQYLGLGNPDDPMNAIRDVPGLGDIKRIAHTPSVSGQIEAEVMKMSEKDPSLVFRKKVYHEIPDSVDGIRQMILDNTESDITFGTYDWTKGEGVWEKDIGNKYKKPKPNSTESE